VPELTSVATQGETIEEATEMAKEAIEAYLEAMHEDGLPIPTDRRGPGQAPVGPMPNRWGSRSGC